MKLVGAALAAHFAANWTTLATCWILDRRDGMRLRLTDHDKPIEIAIAGSPTPIENGTYQAAVGYTASNITSGSDGSVDNLEVLALLNADAITEEDIQGGLYDYAEIRIFTANWADTSMGIMRDRRGRLGEVQLLAGRSTIELRGMQQVLQETVGKTYDPACDADFGDARCKFPIASVTYIGTVQASTDRANLVGSIGAQMAGGSITFLTGANAGRSVEVKAADAMAGSPTFHGIELYEALPNPIAPGDTYSVTAGCDKTPEACKGYNNFVNYRGYPHIPGVDQMLRYPDSP